MNRRGYYMKKAIRYIMAVIICVSVSVGLDAHAALAQIKSAVIAEHKGDGDLTVLFDYDTETVDITFISPSGARFTKNDENVEWAGGDLWSTYRIKNAEEGRWTVEYDPGRNENIDYSVIEDDLGIWIQSFDVVSLDGEYINVSFVADIASGTVNYEYELFAVDSLDPKHPIGIDRGLALSSDVTSVRADMSQLSSGEYTFVLNVFYTDDGTEVFDSASTGPKDFVNAREPSAIDGFTLAIDRDEHTCTVDWSEYLRYSEYRLQFYADDETVYTDTFTRDETGNTVSFPEGTAKLKAELSYRNDIWSAPLKKEVFVDEEYISAATDDITGSGQITIEYKTASNRHLKVVVNDVEKGYSINGTGDIAFDLKEGENSVYAALELDNGISFVVDRTVYFDMTPPQIEIYDDLDGRTVSSDALTIIGRVTGGNTLTVNKEEVQISPEGEFSHEVSLERGENTIELVAMDANGNSASRMLTIYRNTGSANGPGPDGSLLKFLPAATAVLTSMLIALLSLAFMKKRERSQGRAKVSTGALVAWDIAILAADIIMLWQFIKRLAFARSEKYLELAEKSLTEASDWLFYEKVFGVATAVLFVILVISLIFTVKNVQSSGERAR